MTKRWLGRFGWLAIGLAVLGGMAALVNEGLGYRRGEALDWGHVALAVGVPALMYATVRSSSNRRS